MAPTPSPSPDTDEEEADLEEEDDEVLEEEEEEEEVEEEEAEDEEEEEEEGIDVKGPVVQYEYPIDSGPYQTSDYPDSYDYEKSSKPTTFVSVMKGESCECASTLVIRLILVSKHRRRWAFGLWFSRFERSSYFYTISCQINIDLSDLNILSVKQILTPKPICTHSNLRNSENGTVDSNCVGDTEKNIVLPLVYQPETHPDQRCGFFLSIGQ